MKPIPKHTQRAVDQLAWLSKGKSNICPNYDKDELEFCNQEIKIVLSKKSWTLMDKCFKWQFIDKYLSTFSWVGTSDVEHVKDMFTKNQITNLEFSNKERCIKSLGLVINDHAI